MSGVALLGTWASIQWAPTWADHLAGKEIPQAKAYAQIAMAFGACIGTIVGALMGDWLGRRLTYAILCLGSLGSIQLFFQPNATFDGFFIAKLCLAGATTASFYGWLPLYLPELLRPASERQAKDLASSFGRLLAAVGNLQMTNLLFYFDDSFPKACSVMSYIYVVGIVVIFFAPETRGKPLPE